LSEGVVTSFGNSAQLLLRRTLVLSVILFSFFHYGLLCAYGSMR